MSRVYFHTPSGDTELRGSERAYAGGFCSDLAVGLLDLNSTHAVDRLQALIPPEHYLRAVDTTSVGWLPRWASLFGTAFRVSMGDRLLVHRGHEIDPFTVSLNTVMLIGNDQAKFLARMHGQCEMHGWVDGPNRAWLAGIMERGRATGLYRAGQGWEDVIALLRARDDEPVVMSYSVCDQFPAAAASDWMPAWPEGLPKRWDALTETQEQEREARAEAWYDLPAVEQWERGMRWLRAHGGRLELRPDDWDGYTFGNGITALDLVEQDNAERLDRALGLVPRP